MATRTHEWKRSQRVDPCLTNLTPLPDRRSATIHLAGEDPVPHPPTRRSSSSCENPRRAEIWRAPVSCWPPLACRLRRGVLANYSNFWLGLTFSVGFGGLGYGWWLGQVSEPRALSQSRARPRPTSVQRESSSRTRESRECSRAPGFLVKTLGLASGSWCRARDAFIRSLVRFRTSAPPDRVAARLVPRHTRTQDQDGRPEVGASPPCSGNRHRGPTPDMLIRRPPPATAISSPRRSSPSSGRRGHHRLYRLLEVCTHAGCPWASTGAHEEMRAGHRLVRCDRRGHSIFGGAATAASASVVHRRRGIPCQDGYDEPVGPVLGAGND